MRVLALLGYCSLSVIIIEWLVVSANAAAAAASTHQMMATHTTSRLGFMSHGFWGAGNEGKIGGTISSSAAAAERQQRQHLSPFPHSMAVDRRRASAPWGLHATTLPPPSTSSSSTKTRRTAAAAGGGGGGGQAAPTPAEKGKGEAANAHTGNSVTVEDFAAQLEPFGVTGIRFCEDGQEDELAVCCPESRRLMDCTVDMYAAINGTKYCVALPIFAPVAICYHKGERMIPVENECELMDRLYDFLAPTLEQEDLFLIRSPVCLTLDGDLGDLGDEGEFSEEELAGWEEFDKEEDPWMDGEEEEKEEEKDDDEKAEMFDEEVEKLTNPKYWDDAEASDVQEAYGEDWEKIAAFTYDGLDYTMVKILEPVLVLAKEDPDFKGITKWILPSEDEAEEVAPIMEGIIKVKLGIDDLDDDEEEDEEEEE